MNIKELIVPFILAVLGTLTINYFFFNNEQGPSSTADRRFVAPSSVQVAEPLDIDIDFYDQQNAQEKKTIDVRVPYGLLQFSTHGGVIDLIGYNRAVGGNPTLVQTIAPSQSPEKGAFLVALNGIGKTPLYYEFIGKKLVGDTTEVTFKASSSAATITKKFVVHHTTYQIDLALTVDPKQKVRPRIFFPAPHVVGEDGQAQAVLVSGSSLEKKPLASMVQVGVEQPTLFGADDTYFAHVMFNDPQNFTQRAYYTFDGVLGQGVLQAAEIDKKQTWNISFYAGPKELRSLAAVDTRLEGLLSYGWLAPLSKLMLSLLIFLNGIFHNYGIAIIILTILLQILMSPFTFQAEKARKQNEESQRKLAYIERRYKDDPEQLAEAKAEYMRKHGVPGLLGCLPLFLNIPVFLGLRRVLSYAIELYHAPFLWIKDLSSPDPYYILPMILGGAMALQLAQRGDVRQRLVNVMLALFLAAITANFSAGLALYICVSMLCNVAQTYIQKALLA